MCQPNRLEAQALAPVTVIGLVDFGASEVRRPEQPSVEFVETHVIGAGATSQASPLLGQHQVAAMAADVAEHPHFAAAAAADVPVAQGDRG